MSKEDKYEQLRQVCLSYRNEVEELREKLHKCMPYEDAQEFEDFIRNSEKEKYNQQISDLEAKLAESEKESKARYSAWQQEIGESDRLRVALAESKEKCEELKQAISKCTGELPPNVAFDIANDDIRFQIVCNLIDRNKEHRKTIKELKQQLAEKEKEIEELNKFMSDKADELEDLKERISNKITSAYGAELMARDIQWHLEKEIHELQQSQNQTAIAELEKAKEFAKKNKFVVSDYHNLDLAELNYGICFETLCRQIDQQIKKLKDNKNEQIKN